MWFREYMIESIEDNNPSASLPYGLLISRIIVYSLVDLSKYRHVLIDVTYDTRTFLSMGMFSSMINGIRRSLSNPGLIHLGLLGSQLILLCYSSKRLSTLRLG